MIVDKASGFSSGSSSGFGNHWFTYLGPTATARLPYGDLTNKVTGINITASITEDGDVTAATLQVLVSITASHAETGDSSTALVENVCSITVAHNEEGDVTAAAVAVIVSISAAIPEEGDTTTASLIDPATVVETKKIQPISMQC